MKYEDLIEACVEIRRSWNQITHTLDSHAEEFLKKNLDENEKVFIKQVFFGTYRYEEFINAFNTAIFKANPASTNRNDGTLYGIFLYLTVFRFDELPYEEYKKMVHSQNAVKLNVFFQFLFDMNLLRTYVVDEWCKIYDASYIENFVLGGLQTRMVKMGELLASISKKATGKVSDLISTLGSQFSEKESKSDKFKPTQPAPFKLSEPKIKAIPAPIMIPKIVKSNPIPETTYQGSVKVVEETKKKRLEEVKEQTKKKYQEAKAQKFDLKTEKIPTNLEKLKKEAEDKLKADLEKKNFYKPPPTFDKPEFDIKLNAAAVLREELAIKKVKKEEEDYLAQVEMNMRDSGEFKNWKKEQEEILMIEKLEHQERKRIEMQLAREAAMKAVEHKYHENVENVKFMKELSKEHQKEIEQKAELEFEYKKNLKQTVVETKGNAELEKKKMLHDNKVKHDVLKKENKKLQDMKKQEQEIEMKKRKELIAKIRELEKIPVPRTKAYDPTETAGLGLLEEMSIVELRERLLEKEKEVEEWREKKRQEIVTHIETKKEDLDEKLELIKAVREEKASANAKKRHDKKVQEEMEKKRLQAIREKSLLEVSDKVKDKKNNKQAELERIAKELREIKLKRQFLNANAAMVEEKAWKSLQDGAERELEFRQNDKLLEQEKLESIKYGERKILSKRATDLIEDKLGMMREYDTVYERAKEENEVLYREEREDKIRRHETIRNYEQEHLQSMIQRDPFKSKMATFSLTNAKAKQTMTQTHNVVTHKQEIVLPPSKYGDQPNSNSNSP